MLAFRRTFPIGLLLVAFAGPMSLHAASLPKFTEEREAAALFFVKKHCSELMPLLDGLKRNNRTNYELEIREIFQVTEMLANISDDRRHEIELRIWKTENKAFVVVARLSTTKDDEKKPLVSQLHDFAKDLVDLEIQSLELQSEQLEKDLGSTRDELRSLKDNLDKSIKERFDHLFDKAKKHKK